MVQELDGEGDAHGLPREMQSCQVAKLLLSWGLTVLMWKQDYLGDCMDDKCPLLYKVWDHEAKVVEGDLVPSHLR